MMIWTAGQRCTLGILTQIGLLKAQNSSQKLSIEWQDHFRFTSGLATYVGQTSVPGGLGMQNIVSEAFYTRLRCRQVTPLCQNIVHSAGKLSVNANKCEVELLKSICLYKTLTSGISGQHTYATCLQALLLTKAEAEAEAVFLTGHYARFWLWHSVTLSRKHLVSHLPIQVDCLKASVTAGSYIKKHWHSPFIVFITNFLKA